MGQVTLEAPTYGSVGTSCRSEVTTKKESRSDASRSALQLAGQSIVGEDSAPQGASKTSPISMSTVTKVNSLHAVSKPAMIGETLYLDAKSIPPSFNVQDFIGMDSSQAIAVASKWRMPPVTVEKVNTSYAVERPYIIKGTLYLNPAHIPADADVDRLVGRIGMDAIKLASGWKE